MAVQANLLPSHSVKTLGAMEAERTVKRFTFNPTEANPGNNLYVSVRKLNEDEVIVPGSLSLLFNIDLTGGHANNYLVQNVSRALQSHQALQSRAPMGMTFTKSSRTSSFQLMSVKKRFWRVSRVRI